MIKFGTKFVTEIYDQIYVTKFVIEIYDQVCNWNQWPNLWWKSVSNFKIL